MLSAHFPSLYAQRGELPLLAIVIGGAAVRHILNIRFTYRPWKPALAATLVATAALLAVAVGVIPLGRRDASAQGTSHVPQQVTFGDAHRIHV